MSGSCRNDDSVSSALIGQWLVCLQVVIRYSEVNLLYSSYHGDFCIFTVSSFHTLSPTTECRDDTLTLQTLPHVFSLVMKLVLS